MAGVAYYKPRLYLLLVWNIECLPKAATLQREIMERKDYNLRVVVFNWNDEPINFASYGITGGNVVTSSQAMCSVSRDTTLPSWSEYENRNLSPR
jgi:hypothetical protein